MHRRFLLLLLIFTIVMLWVMPGAASEDMADQDALIIMVDLSGSMREKITLARRTGVETQVCPEAATDDREGNERETLSKAAIAKRLILQAAERLVDNNYPFGILAVEYIAGREACYRELIPVGRHKWNRLADEICERLDSDYPLFNRRTPLGDVLRQVDENLLSVRNGKTTLLLISDGRENFHDPDTDLESSRAETLDHDDRVRGPLTETRRLRERYPRQVHLFTLFLEEADTEHKEIDAESLLTQMAQLCMGTTSRGLKWYLHPQHLHAFINSLNE